MTLDVLIALLAKSSLIAGVGLLLARFVTRRPIAAPIRYKCNATFVEEAAHDRVPAPARAGGLRNPLST